MNTTNNARIDIRISKDQKEIIQYASRLLGFKSVSEYIISYISKNSKEIVYENSQILKSLEDKQIFVEALINPPAPNAELKKAQLNYKKFIGTNANNRNSGKRAR